MKVHICGIIDAKTLRQMLDDAKDNEFLCITITDGPSEETDHPERELAFSMDGFDRIQQGKSFMAASRPAKFFKLPNPLVTNFYDPDVEQIKN